MFPEAKSLCGCSKFQRDVAPLHYFPPPQKYSAKPSAFTEISDKKGHLKFKQRRHPLSEKGKIGTKKLLGNELLSSIYRIILSVYSVLTKVWWINALYEKGIFFCPSVGDVWDSRHYLDSFVTCSTDFCVVFQKLAWLATTAEQGKLHGMFLQKQQMLVSCYY